ncbi:MAG: TatD family deoxyribonuclease [Chloroflexi bacterium]|nr:TatD family deoxyribonuclease [Chloroflexota bacterium]
MIPMLSDSHTHLDHYTGNEIAGMVQRARDAGVGIIINVGTTIQTSRKAIALAAANDIVYAGVGIHPSDITSPFTDTDYATLRDLALSHPKVVCIGETGLDFMPGSPDRSWQTRSFREHIRLAKELRKPVDFHARGAEHDILPVLRQEHAGDVGAIWHYFLYDANKAEEAIALGFYISLAKPLLREPGLQEAVKAIPIERIVLETDSYPQPFKKNPARRTEPAHVQLVAQKLAELKSLSVADVSSITTANLRRALRLSP